MSLHVLDLSSAAFCWNYALEQQTDTDSSAVVYRFVSLHTLDLSSIPKLQDTQLAGLHKLRLISISLAGCEHVTGVGLHHVGLVTSLKALDLTGCCKVSTPAVTIEQHFVCHKFPSHRCIV